MSTPPSRRVIGQHVPVSIRLTITPSVPLSNPPELATLPPMPFLVKFGLILLAVGAWTGWIVAAQLAMPEIFERLRIREPRRLLQLHIDYVLMGILVIAVGTVLPDLPVWVQVLIVIGTVLNPLLFLPMAFGPGAAQSLWFRLISVISFVCVTAGLTATAVIGLMS